LVQIGRVTVEKTSPEKKKAKFTKSVCPGSHLCFCRAGKHMCVNSLHSMSPSVASLIKKVGFSEVGPLLCADCVGAGEICFRGGDAG